MMDIIMLPTLMSFQFILSKYKTIKYKKIYKSDVILFLG